MGVPAGIHKIVVGYLSVDFAALRFVNHFYELCRCAAPQLVGANFSPGKYNRTGCDDSAFANFSVIHDNRAHADEGVVADFCAVYGHIVANRHVVTDFDGGFLVERVQHRTILDVDAVAYADGVHIAAQHGVEPYAAIASEDGVADYGGVFCQEAVRAYFWGEPANWNYQCHSLIGDGVEFKWLGVAFEPFQGTAFKFGRQGLTHAGVIFVKPFNFLIGHD